MTVSSGFFNSVNHDRLYDAEQVSSIFDGIIEDGVYESIGEAFMVSPYAEGNDTVIVGTGRAWFDHTWTLNDSQFSFTLSPPNTLLGRIDAIVIDVDRRDSVRANSIVLVEGEYSTTPVKPTLIKEELHNQYPIAYITMPIGTSAPVSQSNIQYMVGTEECPLVTGPLEALNISNYFAQMESEFNVWFDGIKDILNENVAGELQGQIDNLEQEVDNIKNNSINPDVLDAVSNISVKKSTVNIKPNATHVLLPNGQLIILGIYGSDDFNDITDASPQSLYYGIINSDGVYVAKAKLFDLEGDSDVITDSTGGGRCYDVPTLIGTSDANTYPFNIYVTCYDIVWDYDNAPNQDSGYKTRFTEYLVKITVTDTNVVSYTRTSKNAWLYGSYSDVSKDYRDIYSPYLPIRLSDSSYVTCGLVENTRISEQYTFVGSRISSNFIQVYFGEKTTGVSGINGFPIHLIKSSNYDDRFALICTSGTDTDTANEVFSNDFTYLGVMVDGALDHHTPGTSQNYTSFESDLDKIESLSNIYTIGDDGKSIYSNNYTLGDGDTGTDIRPYIDVNRSLTAIASSDTYVKSIITYDNNLLIAGYASGIKVAFTEGSGFMFFSDPVATTAFSDFSKFNIFKYFPNCQYISSDKKRYVFVIKGTITLRDSSALPPIRMPINFDGSNTTDIITIELEG